MLNLILTVGIATTYIASATAKELKPYCGAKNKMIRFCKTDDDCEYSDEVCQDDKCYTVQFFTSDCGKEEKVLTPYCGAKLAVITECKTSWDCLYTDEYCDDQGYCMADLSLYDDFDCLEDLAVKIAEIAKSSDEQKLEALRARDCAAVSCPYGYDCQYGQCFKRSQ